MLGGANIICWFQKTLWVLAQGGAVHLEWWVCDQNGCKILIPSKFCSHPVSPEYGWLGKYQCFHVCTERVPEYRLNHRDDRLCALSLNQGVWFSGRTFPGWSEGIWLSPEAETFGLDKAPGESQGSENTIGPAG